MAAIQKLAVTAKVPEETAKQWLVRQALLQTYLPALHYIPCLNLTYQHPQVDLLFVPHDKLRRSRKVYTTQ